MASLRLKGLTKRFPSGGGVLGVDAEFPEEAYHIILGPSGAGKSTLLRLIAGLETPDSGIIMIDGDDVTFKPPYEREVAIVFQEPVLFPHLSILENILFPLEARGMENNKAKEKAYEVASLLRIEGLLDRMPDQISGGEKQRVSIARALVTEPGVILLDEPYSNLDLSLRESLRWEIRRLLLRLGVTVIHVTHDQDEALELGDTLSIMYKGRMVGHGDLERVYRHPGSIEAARVLAHNILETSEGCIVFPVDGISIIDPPCSKGLKGSLKDVRRRRGYVLAVYDTSLGEVKTSIPPYRKPPREACIEPVDYEVIPRTRCT